MKTVADSFVATQPVLCSRILNNAKRIFGVLGRLDVYHTSTHDVALARI